MIRGPFYRLRPDVVHRSLGDEHYLLSADSAFHTVDDPVGALLLARMADGRRHSRDALARAVLGRFDGPESVVMSDVSAFLDTLVDRNVLLRDPPEGPSERG
jgi:hypothetical protein